MPTLAEKTTTPGYFVRCAGKRGVFKIMFVNEQGVTVYGGDKHRRQFHTFYPDRLKPAKAPDWAKESRT